MAEEVAEAVRGQLAAAAEAAAVREQLEQEAAAERGQPAEAAVQLRP